MADSQSQLPYKAFISYSGTSGYRMVRELEGFLEGFHALRTPTGIRLEKLEICTDISDFTLPSAENRLGNSAAKASVWPLIESHLEKSQYLVVLGSPEAAHSEWVARECAWFLKHRGPSFILLAVIWGDPAADARHVFPTDICDAGLPQSQSWYDFRGRAGRRAGPPVTGIIRDFDEQRIRLAADLLGRSAGELQPLWFRQERARQRQRLIALSIISIVLLGLLIAALVARRQAQQERALAEERQRLATSRQLAAEALTQIDTLPEQAVLFAMAARSIEVTAEADRALLAALEDWPQLDRLLYRGAGFPVTVAVSPDGRMIAAGTLGGELLRFDARTGEQIAPAVRIGGVVEAVRFTPQSDGIVTGNDNGDVSLWSAASGRIVRAFHVPIKAKEDTEGEISRPAEKVRSVAVSRDGTRIAAGTAAGIAFVWDAETGRQIGPGLRGDGVLTVTFDPRDGTLITGSMDDGVRFWNLATSKTTRRLPVHKSTGNWDLAVDPSGRYLAVSSRTGTLELWDRASPGKPPRILGGFRGDVGELAFSPDGTVLAAGDSQDVSLWDVGTARRLDRQNMSHSDVVKGLAFSPDGRILTSAGADGTLRMWRVAESSSIGGPLGKHEGEAERVAFSPNGAFLASCGHDGTVLVWDVNKKILRYTLRHGSAVRDIAFDPQNRLLASAGDDGRVRFWRLSDGSEARAPLAHPDVLRHVSFSPNGRQLAAGMDGGAITIWNLTSASPPVQISRRGDSLISDVVFTIDGSRIMASVGDRDIGIWDAATGKLLETLSQPEDSAVTALALSADGHWLASGGTGPLIQLWHDLRPVRPLTGLRSNVYGLSFGRNLQLASAANEGVWLWDAARGTRFGRRLYAKTLAQGVAFSPDGNHIAVASFDGTAWLWDLHVEAWERAACRIANRDLSREEWNDHVGTAPYVPICSGLRSRVAESASQADRTRGY